MPIYKIEYYSATGQLLGDEKVEFSGLMVAEQQMAVAMRGTTHKIKSTDKDGNATLDVIATNHIANLKITEHR